MAIVDEYAPTAPAKPSFARQLSSAQFALFRALGAGWRASVEYRRLHGLSDSKLQQCGLSRTDIPHELHQKYFASLGG